MHKVAHHVHHHVRKVSRIIFWFSLGGIIGFFFFVSFAYIFYQQTYHNRVYPGVYINGKDFSGATGQQIQSYFQQQNKKIADIHIVWKYDDQVASTSALSLGVGYNTDLLVQQALSIGRSPDVLANASLLFQAYINGIQLPASYSYNDDRLVYILEPLVKQINVHPINASFTLNNNRVANFSLAQNGQQVNIPQIRQQLIQTIPAFLPLLIKAL